MTKNVPKNPLNIFFWKNGFRHFFFDKIICLGARDKKNLMNSYGEKPGRTHARTHKGEFIGPTSEVGGSEK